jgi:hypothetical protein
MEKSREYTTQKTEDCKYEYNIKKNLKEKVQKAWSGFIWLRIKTNGGFL